jgi:hydroxymethylglutaryl-CoA lyase
VPDDDVERAIITDVTLREYGQNIPANFIRIFTPEIRVDLALQLIAAGFANIEILSCVHPKVAPAMNEEALRETAEKLGKIDGVNLITLVPNKPGYDTFLCAGLGPDGYNHTMGLFFSAIEAHNLANLGKPIKETIDECKVIAGDARSRGIRIRAYISAAFGYLDPERGAVLRADIDEIDYYIDLFLGFGAEALTFSDLQGVASQDETREILEAILGKRKGRDIEKLGYHPHHVSGHRAIANSNVAYDLGIRRFDASLGGTGGCITGAPGNQPTEELIRFFHSRGIETGISEAKVFSLAERIHRDLYRNIQLI